MAQSIHLDLTENEIKLLIVAIRQVKHTFSIAEQQSTAAGEPLPEDYSQIQEAYDELLHKLEPFAPPPPPAGEKPFRVK